MKKIILVIVNYFIVGIISYTILFSVLITIAAVILQNYIIINRRSNNRWKN